MLQVLFILYKIGIYLGSSCICTNICREFFSYKYLPLPNKDPFL